MEEGEGEDGGGDQVRVYVCGECKVPSDIMCRVNLQETSR